MEVIFYTLLMRILFLTGMYWGWIFMIFLTDPFYGILEYTFINIIRPEQLLWGMRGAVGRIFLAVQAASFTSWIIHKEKLTPEYTPTPRQIKLMVVISLAMIISTIFATGPVEQSWKWTSQFMKTTLFCFVMSKSINTAKKLEQYYTVSVVWLMLLQMWGIQQKLGGNVRMEGLGGDQLGDVNDLASIGVLYFPMAYYFLYNRKKMIKLFVGIPTTIVSIIFILFGGSRGAFLGLAACMAMIFLRTPGLQKFKMLFTFAIVGFLFIVIFGALAPEGFFDEYINRLNTILGKESAETGEVEQEGSAAGRIAMWKAAYYFMRQHPEFWLTGLGMRGFSAVYFRYIDEIEPHLTPEEYEHILYGGQGGKAVHNAYINMATSGGLLMFVPWMFLFFYAWFQAHRIPARYPKIVNGVVIHNYAKAVEIGLVGAYVTITFINTEFVDFYYWFMLMPGIIANLAVAKLKREEAGLEDDEFEISPISRRSRDYQFSR